MALRSASDPLRSRGRQYRAGDEGTRGPRDDFQRDRDRIIHSIAFRRLANKTQVFVAPDGDHFRVRLTHSLEVAQIGRSIARALGLNEDLTEAIALAHDIGHPPFGHAGETALKAALADVGGFDHNGHTLRALAVIESPYPGHPGLNLTWETLEGLAKHNGPVEGPGWALAAIDAAFPLDLSGHASLEAQVAALADDIAYDNHDIDDGIRAGLLSLDEVIAEPLPQQSWQAVTARHPGASRAALQAAMVREQIGRMVNDLLEESRRRLAALDPADADAVRAAGRPLIAFSDGMAEAERGLKRFMYRRLYHHDRQLAVAAEAGRVVRALADACRADPRLLPPDWQARLPADEPARGRHVGDFIAGMTDRYALAQHVRLIGPVAMPEGF